MMHTTRRTCLAGGLSLAALFAAGRPASAYGVDATTMGVRPGAADDQTRALQGAIDRAAGARIPLVLPPGAYRAGDLRLPAGARIVGVRGATRLIFSAGAGLFSAARGDSVSLDGLTLDGGGKLLPQGRGLIHIVQTRRMLVSDCEIIGAGGNAIHLEGCDGEIVGNAVTGSAQGGIFARDSRGLSIIRNNLRGSANNGILVWRTEAGDDGTLVASNRIEDTSARAGGSGQNGNAINVYRAANVVVSGNQIRSAAFSAVRGNAASNLQVLGNNAVGCGEVALYAEFGFEGAVIASNVVDGAALGIAITNYSSGGRLAVCQGNLIRNLTARRPAGTDPGDIAGVGIGVEADTAVTGNVIERAPAAGIWVGWGPHQRDVAVTGNVIRQAPVGVAVQVADGAGAAVIADNLIAGATQGAVVGMEWRKAVTGDLAAGGTTKHAQISVSGNRVR
jgi:uncharacterized secreted repeat protein (TIGR03808 family)